MQDMINVDKAGFKIENTSPRFDKTVLWMHCYLEGEYNWEKKVNCMMAICANLHYNMEWHNIWPQEEGGTELFSLYAFFFRGIAQLAINHPGRSFCFTMDNLNTLKTQWILA
jgi:hypothetical protein